MIRKLREARFRAYRFVFFRYRVVVVTMPCRTPDRARFSRSRTRARVFTGQQTRGAPANRKAAFPSTSSATVLRPKTQLAAVSSSWEGRWQLRPRASTGHDFFVALAC